MLYEKLKKIEDTFINFFKKEGFEGFPSQPIIPINDDSLYFTNSTIVNFKPLLINDDLPTKGIFNSQHCLRLKNISHVLDENSEPYISLFKMLGTIVPETGFSDLFDKAIELFNQEYHIPKDNICIKVSSRDEILYKKVSELDIPKETNVNDDKFYQWVFGMERMDGRGITFAIKQPNGKFSDVGQIIQIRKDGKPIAYEFAFGREALLKRIEGTSPFYKSWPAYPIVEDKYGKDSWKVMDAISTLSVLYASNATPDKSKRGMLVKKALSNAISIQLEKNITDIEFNKYISQFSSNELNNKTDIDRLMIDLNVASKTIKINMNKLDYFCQKQKENISQNKISFEEAIAKCFNMGEGSYFVPDPQKKSIMGKYFKKDNMLPIVQYLKQKNRSK